MVRMALAAGVAVVLAGSVHAATKTNDYINCIVDVQWSLPAVLVMTSFTRDTGLRLRLHPGTQGRRETAVAMRIAGLKVGC
jgi:hypothetical protein